MSRVKKRAYERISVDLEVEFYTCDRVQCGRVMNISEKGMFVSMKEMSFPFDSRLEILIPSKEDKLQIPVSLTRIEMSPDQHDGIGVELLHASEEYIKFLDSLRSSL